MTRFFLALCLLLASALAQATTTYTYTGQPYTGAATPYTTAMAITGTFTVATALPANFSGAISSQITSFSFSDGVRTYSNATASIYSALVATDSDGAISGALILLTRWETGSSPHATSDLLGAMGIYPTYDYVYTNMTCSTVVDDHCTDLTGADLVAQSSGSGSWARSTTAVPTLSEWGLVIMAMLMLLAFVPYRPVRR